MLSEGPGGSQQEGWAKGTGAGMLKLSELEHWGVQVFAEGPEPLAKMFLLPHDTLMETLHTPVAVLGAPVILEAC